MFSRVALFSSTLLIGYTSSSLEDAMFISFSSPYEGRATDREFGFYIRAY